MLVSQLIHGGDGTEGTFVSMVKDFRGLYSAEIPKSDANIIFVRMNPATADNNWNNVWNQTADLTIPAGYNHFTLNEGEWDGANGSWDILHDPQPTTQPTSTQPTTNPIVTGSTIYFAPSSGWKQDNAHFAMYMWNDSGDKFVAMTKNSNDIYTAELPEGFSNVIFVRMNPATTDVNWDNKWNQSADITVPAGKNYFTLNENEWDGANGTWSSYVLPTEPTEPTTVPPTTAPTQPVTTQPITTQPVTTEPTEPTTVPVSEFTYRVLEDGTAEITGDIDLALLKTDENIYSADIELKAGTYKFNVDHAGAVLGFNASYTDTANINYSGGFKAQSTLIATGGRYTFTFNTATKELKIKHKSFDDIVELKGGINTVLVRPNKNTTVFTGTVKLTAGTYYFNVYEGGQIYGLNHLFEDVIYDHAFLWTTPTGFKATGGTYSVKYDSATNKLKILHTPAGLGDVRAFGDFNLDLTHQGNNIYSARTTFEPGEYQFRMDVFGKTVCNGSYFTDTMSNVPYNTEWKAATTFNVSTKMNFTFIFDTNTNMLKVFSTPIDTTMVRVIFESYNLELSTTDNVTYSCTTYMQSGTHSFRIDEFGTTMCYGGTFKDSIPNLPYSSSYKSATTFVATGGTYTFSYNVNTHKLATTKVSE